MAPTANTPGSAVAMVGPTCTAPRSTATAVPSIPSSSRLAWRPTATSRTSASSRSSPAAPLTLTETPPPSRRTEAGSRRAPARPRIPRPSKARCSCAATASPRRQPRHLVLAQQAPPALVQPASHLVAVARRRRPVQRHLADAHPQPGRGAGGVEQRRGLEQRLGGDAAAVQAGAAHLLALHHRGGQPQLGGAVGCHVAPRPPTDDGDVAGLCHVYSCLLSSA